MISTFLTCNFSSLLSLLSSVSFRMTNEQLAEAVVMMKGGRKADDSVDPIFGLRGEPTKRGGVPRENPDIEKKNTILYGGVSGGISGGSINAIESDVVAIKGFDICDHRYLLRTYPNTFVGSEAVLWMCDHLSISEEDAIKLGQVHFLFLLRPLSSHSLFFSQNIDSIVFRC